MGDESLTTTLGYLHLETAAIKCVIDQRNRQKLEDTVAHEEGGEPRIEGRYAM